MVVIAIILVVVFYCYHQYKLKNQRKEALCVVQRWKKDTYVPGKAVMKDDGDSKVWSKPPDTHAMVLPDLHSIPLGLINQPMAAIHDVENLPLLPSLRYH